jgi:hypothetical protein
MKEMESLESWDGVEEPTFVNVEHNVPEVGEDGEVVTEMKSDEAASTAEEGDVTSKEVEEVQSDEPVEEVEINYPDFFEKTGLKMENDSLLVKAKADGKEDFVSLDELKQNYAGKVAWDKKYTELDIDKKAFQKEKAQIEGYVNEFNRISREQNALEGAKYLAQLSGKAPHQFMDELIEVLRPELERRDMLTDQELQLEKQQAFQKYSQEQLEAKQKQFEAEQAQIALQDQIESAKSNHKIANDEWDATVKELDERLPKDQVITPETVTDYIGFKRELRAERALGTFNAGQLADNAEVKSELIKVINDMPDLTDTEIQEILAEAFIVKEKQEVEEKLAGKAKKSNTNKKTDKPSVSELSSWDEVGF